MHLTVIRVDICIVIVLCFMVGLGNFKNALQDFLFGGVLNFLCLTFLIFVFVTVT